MFIELTKGLDGDALVWKFWQTTGKTEDIRQPDSGRFLVLCSYIRIKNDRVVLRFVMDINTHPF